MCRACLWAKSRFWPCERPVETLSGVENGVWERVLGSIWRRSREAAGLDRGAEGKPSP